MSVEQPTIKSRESKLPPVPKNSLDVLGIGRGASKKEITHAFRKRSLAFHQYNLLEKIVSLCKRRAAHFEMGEPRLFVTW